LVAAGCVSPGKPNAAAPAPPPSAQPIAAPHVAAANEEDVTLLVGFVIADPRPNATKRPAPSGK
jgi:hypothetical protein